jgi:hypothetical protein
MPTDKATIGSLRDIIPMRLRLRDLKAGFWWLDTWPLKMNGRGSKALGRIVFSMALPQFPTSI